MYHTYQKDTSNGAMHFQKRSIISIAGCNKGIIAKHLNKVIDKTFDEPLGWTIEIKDLIEQIALDGNTIIIDMKPNSEKEVLLFELITIHGYSSFGWTPILLEFKEVLTDEDPAKWNKDDFTIQKQSNQIVRAFLYLRGSIKKGELYGKWIFAPPSSTNGALLWLNAWNFFVEKTSHQKRLRKVESLQY